MFAIAIWDGRASRLVLARDRLGKKPLYWRLANGRLTYGSELKAILQDPERRASRRPRGSRPLSPAPVCARALDDPPRRIEAPTREHAVWDGGEPTDRTLLDASYGPKSKRDFHEDVEEGLEIIREAVRLRLRSDVPVGVFLSGGMDSSVVTALMAEQSSQPVRTFSIGFENQAYDELRYARAVADRYEHSAHARRSFVSTRSSCCLNLPITTTSPSPTHRRCPPSASRRSPAGSSRSCSPATAATSPSAATRDTA